jgi:hypothetical protein
MNDDKQEEVGLSYYPTEIETVVGKGGRVHHIDEQGRKTYPSWAKRAKKQVILPEDLGEARREPTREDERLHHALCQAMHIQGFEMSQGIPTKKVVRALMEITKVRTFAAYQVLYGLWRAGLVTRVGRIYHNGNRPMHQRWYLDGKSINDF